MVTLLELFVVTSVEYFMYDTLSFSDFVVCMLITIATKFLVLI